MSRAPPVPRKPASYSPSFLARDEFHVPEPVYDCKSPYEDYDDLDRDFALDMYPNTAGDSRSRPNSQGSAYGRPLPSPPSSGRTPLRMPEPDSSFAYDGLLSDYEYDTQPYACSQTTLGTYPAFDIPTPYESQYGSPQRPLPQAPQQFYTEFQTQAPYEQRYDQDRFDPSIRIYEYGSGAHYPNGGSAYNFNHQPDNHNFTHNQPDCHISDHIPDRPYAAARLQCPVSSSQNSEVSNVPLPQSDFNARHSMRELHDLTRLPGGQKHSENHLRSLSHDVRTLEIAPQDQISYARPLPMQPLTNKNELYQASDVHANLPARYSQENQDFPITRSDFNVNHTQNSSEYTSSSSPNMNNPFADISTLDMPNQRKLPAILQPGLSIPAHEKLYSSTSFETGTMDQQYSNQDAFYDPQVNQPASRAPGWNKTLPSIYQPPAPAEQARRDFPRSQTVSGRVPVRDPLPHSLTSTSAQISTLLPLISKDSKKLSTADYQLCREAWSRSALFSWLKQMNVSTEEELLQSCVGLFTHNIPTLSNASAYTIAASILHSFIAKDEVVRILENTKSIRLATEAGDGVLPALTNNGCYSSRCHQSLNTSRCYSSRCSRTIPIRHERPELSKVNDANDWAQFWGLQVDHEPLSSLDKREIQRQYQVHEVIYSESEYVKDLKVLRDVFQHKLAMSLDTDQEFAQLVFGQIPRLLDLAEDELEKDLKSRQAEQGPVISNIGDIFLTWIKRAAPIYIAYAARMGYADRAIRNRKVRSPIIREWLLDCESDSRTKKLSFSSFHGSPTRRMQRYALLLGDVLKRTFESSADYSFLTDAITEIKKVCTQCNTEVEICQNKIALSDLGQGLIWQVSRKDLNLDDPSRELRHRGMLQRKSESHTSWQQRELVLLDNYFLCLKPSKDGAQKVISRNPIPVDFLLVDDHDEVISKSSSSKIIGGTITHTVSSLDQSQQGRKSTFESSTSSIRPSDGSSSPLKSTSETLFPFSIRHAGRPDEKMTFYAESPVARSAWLSAIQEARSVRWSKISGREPFRVQLLAADTFGTYAIPRGGISSVPRPTNAIEAVLAGEHKIAEKTLSKARVFCSTVFLQDNKREICLLGTDDGIYCNESGTWTQAIAIPRVTQIAVLEEFGVLTVLSDKMLIAFNLEDVLSAKTSTGAHKAPQKLSGKQNVGFFEVGLLKGRMLVIYKKKENSNSVFKALEPVIGRKQEKKSFFKKSTSASSTDFFRDFDQFFIPTECYGMQFLRTTICIKCSRGFEVMSLDSKQPVTIPDLSSSQTASLRNRISGAKPLGTYRVQEGEFLCCYAECGLFVDPSGSISRPHTIEWEGHPEHAVLLGNYVVAIGKEFIEIWNVEKRALRQVITGHDIRCLPLSSAGGSIDMSSRGIIIAMSHPLRSDRQLVFELQLVK